MKWQEGRRTAAESEFIDKVLFELRMNYVDETRRDESGRVDAKGGAPDAPGAGESDDERTGAAIVDVCSRALRGRAHHGVTAVSRC